MSATREKAYAEHVQKQLHETVHRLHELGFTAWPQANKQPYVLLTAESAKKLVDTLEVAVELIRMQDEERWEEETHRKNI